MKSGVLNLYKPKGMTSHDVVSFVRHTLHRKKVGHTGTLDPDAEGVLPICVGNATKAADLLTAAEKRYRAVLRLGVTTDTEDMTGAVLTRQSVSVTEEQLASAVQSFTGEILQVPPMYSAVKQNGKKLYELARSGITVERKGRPVTIYSIRILDFAGETATLDIHCSKGTYIRTLCADIGAALSCGGCMEALLRTQSGRFCLEDASTLSKLEEAAAQGTAEQLLIPTDQLFDYPCIHLDSVQSGRVRCGVPIYYRRGQMGQTYRVYDDAGVFLCLSRIMEQDGAPCLKLVKSFYGEAN